MSKLITTTLSVDEDAKSIGSVQLLRDDASSRRIELERELFSLIMSTPKDVTPDDCEPSFYLGERFDDIIGDLRDAFVDEFKYDTILQDVRFNEDSPVRKLWEEEEEEERKFRETTARMNDFFSTYGNILDKYNVDDYSIFLAWNEGKIEIPDPFSKEERDVILRNIKNKDGKE